jgi:hypothetical protein
VFNVTTRSYKLLELASPYAKEHLLQNTPINYSPNALEDLEEVVSDTMNLHKMDKLIVKRRRLQMSNTERLLSKIRPCGYTGDTIH